MTIIWTKNFCCRLKMTIFLLISYVSYKKIKYKWVHHVKSKPRLASRSSIRYVRFGRLSETKWYSPSWSAWPLNATAVCTADGRKGESTKNKAVHSLNRDRGYRNSGGMMRTVLGWFTDVIPPHSKHVRPYTARALLTALQNCGEVVSQKMYIKNVKKILLWLLSLLLWCSVCRE